MSEELDEQRELERNKSFMDLLGVNGYHTIEVNYSGSGDSGDIDSIYLLKYKEVFSYNSETGKENIEDRIKEITADCEQWVRDKANEILSGIEDWWNNDGGYGTMVIQIPSGTYVINNNINVTDVESHQHSGSFLNETEE
jgi:hypothetical protein